ncbi:MAG: putative zinc-binding metallopeptidase [Gammaproteobacteria bacterium]|nr:putative zinc-binding metallopeptidase [Gammaproteobacteria bacterium]
MPTHRKRCAGNTRLPDYHWADYDDEALLALRFSSLRLRLRNSLVWPEVEQLRSELERRGMVVKPHVWLSTEWFCPDGVPGIAIPFYLAHPRLRQLERNMMGDVEGGSRTWRMRILRHEAGHAIDNAYALRRRADWRAVFGRASARYPDDYSPRPSSRRYVLHLGHWYAQSHPTEDFAETFAVWMQPKARWRRDYEGWPALRKLEFVDCLMEEVAEAPPKRRSRIVVESLSEVDMTLGEHYRQRMARYGGVERRYDRWISRVFMSRVKRPRGIAASRFVREIEPQMRRLLERRARLHPYFVDHAIRTVRRRARELDLVLRHPRRDAKRSVVRLHERIVLDILRRNRENYAL